MLKRIIGVLLIICMCVGVFTGCGNKTSTQKKVVIATTFAAYDWARAIVGDTKNVEVKYLVDQVVDLHSYKPTAADIIEYKNADMVLSIGGESEEWLQDIDLPKEKVLSLMDTVNALKEECVEGMEAEEEEEAEDEGVEYDEHIWLSLKNASASCKEICSRLVSLNPENKDTYRKNTEEYIKQLDELDGKYSDVVRQGKTKTILFGDRFPFRYMVNDYGLTYYAAFIGCSAETEASFETVAFLAKKVDELGLKYICVIGDNHEIANVVRDNTKTKDQQIVTFDSLQAVPNTDKKASYLILMEQNLEALKTVLQ
ncbi:MAG: zinc ABC transporter substrate-binding protein [Lachnospiraceae bacterium]|nr:zinc ABC transporter substrate-binding protein [Lachnospiraceae bacterium]